MSKTNPDIQTALSDVDYMRRILEGRQGGSTNGKELLPVVFLAALAIALLIIELATDGGLTVSFLVSRGDQTMKWQGLLNILAVTGMIVMVIYGLAWARARELHSTLDRVIGREFKYLTVQSFLPDLLLKFTFLSLIVWQDQPGLVGPTLTAFVADYVLQGRFFRIPQRWLAGGAIYAVAIWTFAIGNVSLIPPLTTFALVSLVSMCNVWMKRAKNV